MNQEPLKKVLFEMAEIERQIKFAKWLSHIALILALTAGNLVTFSFLGFKFVCALYTLAFTLTGIVAYSWGLVYGKS